MSSRLSRLTAGPHVAPSILAADHGALRSAVSEIVSAGAQVIHVDIMDGHFVPPLTFGPGVVESLRRDEPDIVLDVHLMVERPERLVADFARAGADVITVHAEATPHVHYALQSVREAGCAAGLAVCPGTPLGFFSEVEVDLALCMTVNPGWGGQAFIPASLAKLRRLGEILGGDARIEVDGGIDEQSAGACAGAGADLFVAGSAVFGADDPAEAFRLISEAAASGAHS